METRKCNVNGKEYLFVNESSWTRNGFKHTSTLFVDNREVGNNTVHYLNRTWENYTFQTVMLKVIGNLIDYTMDNLKNAFKSAKGYQKLTQKRNEEFNESIKDNRELAELYEVRSQLRGRVW